MAVVKFYENIKDEKLSFAVVISKMNGKWVLCKHKDRTTFEFPGGHREIGETILETAKRELQEETGAKDFKIKQICYYSDRSKNQNNIKYGALFVAEIFSIDNVIHSEMESIDMFDEIPDNLTYPEVTEKLIETLNSIRVKPYE